MSKVSFFCLRPTRSGVLPIFAGLIFFTILQILPVTADQPVLEDGSFVALMAPAIQENVNTDEVLAPDAGLAWTAGPVNDSVSAEFVLPGVVWHPAMSAQTWYGSKQGPSTFTMASAMGMNPARESSTVAELVAPRPAQAAGNAEAKSVLPKVPADKTVIPVKNPAKTAEKTVAAVPATPPATVKPTVSAVKDGAAALPKGNTIQAKDPVPSPASIHNKEMTAKTRENPKLAATKILLDSTDAVLQPAPVVGTPPSPAQMVPSTSRTMSGEQGSIIEINMDGHGWLYTGAPGTAVLASFIEKKTLQNSEVFRFRLAKEGLSSLSFKRQDLSSGFADEVNVSLIAMPRGGVQSRTGTQASAASLTAPALTGRDPSLAQTPAAVAYQAPAAVQAPTPLDLSGIPESGRLGYARDLARTGHGSDALRLLEPLASEAKDDLDEVLFLMAGIYQDDARQRDLKKAFGLLVRIQKEFPRSPFASRAREQALYLKRTFQVD